MFVPILIVLGTVALFVSVDGDPVAAKAKVEKYADKAVTKTEEFIDGMYSQDVDTANHDRYND